MRRLLALGCMLAIACGEWQGGNPTTPTPVPFPLPAGAPSDAAAASGTARITITAVEILGPDGARVAPDKLKVTPALTTYNMRVWIFCPAGLEGPKGSGWNAETLEFLTRKTDPMTNSGGTFAEGLRLEPGYTVLESPLSLTRKGQQRVTTEILRNFAVIARNEFVATFSE